MRIVLLLIFLFFGIKSFEQIKTDSFPTINRDTLPAVFNYARDFKMIVEKTKDKTSAWYYHKLLPKYLNEDSTISKQQTLALMIGFTEDPHFKPWEDLQTEKEIFELNDSTDYQGSLDASKIYLQTHPFSLRILNERSYSYNQLRMKDSADYFMNFVDKVMNAMIYSGKGKTPETPVFSLGLADGEYFIPNVGMTVAGKTTDWNKNHHFVEVIDAMNEMGVHANYYFVIQHAKDKIDDDTVNDTPVKKSKKSSKKKDSKDNKKSKASGKDNKENIKDSIPPAAIDSMPPAPIDSIPH
ncbi:MAG: DUF4919 domain-containing protein [Ferruginibacter sp.]